MLSTRRWCCSLPCRWGCRTRPRRGSGRWGQLPPAAAPPPPGGGRRPAPPRRTPPPPPPARPRRHRHSRHLDKGDTLGMGSRAWGFVFFFGKPVSCFVRIREKTGFSVKTESKKNRFFKNRFRFSENRFSVQKPPSLPTNHFFSRMRSKPETGFLPSSKIFIRHRFS